MSLAPDLREPGPRFDSVAAFLDWASRQDRRYELLDGVARAMTGGSKAHAQISRNALVALAIGLKCKPCEPFGSDFAVLPGDLNQIYPDASVSCAPEGPIGLASPVVVIEVLSPSTEARDRGEKAFLYRRIASLRHLVLVRQDRIGVEHYHRTDDTADFTLTDLDRLDDVLALDAIELRLPLVDLYSGVSFA